MSAGGEAGARFVACRVGATLCAIPLSHVVETMRPLPTEPLATPHAFVLGASVVRGEPVPVIDAARLLGIADASPPGRFVVLKLAAGRAALAVGAVDGVCVLAPASLGALPSLLDDARLEAIGTLDSSLLVVLRSARVVPEDVWAAVAAGGAA
jgi:purine-binding chemotaxis protein CheW